ncbi:hypothetical protein K503DRAFT_805412 [Rhizopogon vinicolor AM-OR11-026]|uniref:CLASP N-terminal domain-containing protein n=1 Tax=Rhizopogon vinicolor AM-OR11-026 TaxID=1314800 RepID=A0A1B7MHX5_9AGAM|nr:hypothetical protein K503DRAFT_805412 [Rhizopogon vinicolor AM-OR11-026]
MILAVFTYSHLCSSPSVLKTQLEAVRCKVSFQETGAFCDTIEEGILNLTKISNHGACKFTTEVVAGIHSLQNPQQRSANHKSANLRLLASEGVLTCLNSFILLDDTHVRLLEDVIKSAAQDASADVRATGKMVLEAYKAPSPDSEEGFIAPQTAASKMQLDTAAEGSKFLNLRHLMTEGVTLVESSAPQSALRAPSELGYEWTKGHCTSFGSHHQAPSAEHPRQATQRKASGWGRNSEGSHSDPKNSPSSRTYKNSLGCFNFHCQRQAVVLDGTTAIRKIPRRESYKVSDCLLATARTAHNGSRFADGVIAGFS